MGQNNIIGFTFLSVSYLSVVCASILYVFWLNNDVNDEKVCFSNHVFKQN